MGEESTFKFTDLDYLTGSHHLQMLKAALPYVNISEQRLLSILAKFKELQNTISLFEEKEVSTMGICSLNGSPPRPGSPLDMLEAMKPYGTLEEQDFLDMVCNFVRGCQLGNQYQEMRAQSVPPSTVPPSTVPPASPMSSSLPPSTVPPFSEASAAPFSSLSSWRDSRESARNTRLNHTRTHPMAAQNIKNPNTVSQDMETRNTEPDSRKSQNEKAENIIAQEPEAPNRILKNTEKQNENAQSQDIQNTEAQNSGSPNTNAQNADTQYTETQNASSRNAHRSSMRNTLDQLKFFLTPQQQSQLETVTMMMQFLNPQERSSSHAS